MTSLSNTSIVIAIILLGIITFLYRYSFISSYGQKFAKNIPEQLLKFLGPATFGAIIANSLFATQAGNKDLAQKLLVIGLSIVVAYKTKSVVITTTFGLVLLYIIQNFVN